MSVKCAAPTSRLDTLEELTGLDRLQLIGIADQHDLGLGLIGRFQ